MNLVNKNILFFCSLFLSAVLWGENPVAVPQELPIPFCYFENLYFQPRTSTFLVLNNPTLPGKAINLWEKRGYTFKHTHRPLIRVEQIEGTALFLFEGKGSTCCTYHFFHILEHIVGFWSFYGDQHFEDVNLIVLGSAGENTRAVWEGPNEINKHVLRALFPNAEVKIWREFLEEFQGRAYCFERALTSDRRLSYDAPECRQLNRLLGVARHSLSQDALKNLADHVHAYAKTEIQNTKALRITYLKRSPPRTLDPAIEEKLLSSIRLLDNVSLRVEDFAKISFKEQIHIIGNTDVLISVHGNGLSHVLFLPPSSKVIEIFPPGVHTVDYRIFAEARGFDYTGIISDRGVISQEESNQLGAVGNFSTTIHELDVDLILNAIRPSF